MNDLQRAMHSADLHEKAAGEAGHRAVAAELVTQDPPRDITTEQRQSAALDDAIAIVAAHRWRLGQPVNRDDGVVVRRIHALLRDLEAGP